MSKISLIVVGEMNTDLIISGLPHFPVPGELVNGEQFSIGPGGKSRNIAAMSSVLMPPGTVAFISKTIKDHYGLWEIPLKALGDQGVDTRFVQILESKGSDHWPGIAVILIDKKGNNQIIGAPGITREFDIEDIDVARTLFKEVGSSGYMAFIGNCPIGTAKYAIKKAVQQEIKVVFDPGGADDLLKLNELLDKNIYLFKPNEHEVKEITGIPVTDLGSAQKAAHKLLSQGVHNVMITAGSKGAYLFTNRVAKHIPVPSLALGGPTDETGCGDQAMAALCANLQTGEPLEKAAEIAILAGTLQFHKTGVQPITQEELSVYKPRSKA